MLGNGFPAELFGETLTWQSVPLGTAKHLFCLVCSVREL